MCTPQQSTIADRVALLPLTKVVVRGTYAAPVGRVGASGASAPAAAAPIVRTSFTDALYGVNVLKLASDAPLDVDCVKAGVLSLHARYHATVSFVCPTFVFERNVPDMRACASLYGAFVAPQRVVAGVVQLMSRRWSSFVLSLATRECSVYAPSRAEFDEVRALLAPLVQPHMKGVTFVLAPPSSQSQSQSQSEPPRSPLSPASPASAQTTTSTTDTTSSSVTAASADAQRDDSGVLALLFIELALLEKTWRDVSDALVHSPAYFRARLLLQAIQVVNKQDVHDIQWL